MSGPAITLENWLSEKPFELSLGAGFFGFYAHLGVVKALAARGLTPVKIYGASAGAIVGAFWARGYAASEMEKIFSKIKREDFWDPSLGFGLLKGEKYHALLSDYLPPDFSALKIPLEMSVFDVFSLRTKILRAGDLLSSVRGSSAFPGLFHPVRIGGRIFLDGGIGDQLGLAERKSEKRLLIHSFGRRIKNDSEHFFLNLKNIPRSGPNRMHLASEIIECAYKQMNEKLYSEISLSV